MLSKILLCIAFKQNYKKILTHAYIVRFFLKKIKYLAWDELGPRKMRTQIYFPLSIRVAGGMGYKQNYVVAMLPVCSNKRLCVGGDPGS